MPMRLDEWAEPPELLRLKAQFGAAVANYHEIWRRPRLTSPASFLRQGSTPRALRFGGELMKPRRGDRDGEVE